MRKFTILAESLESNRHFKVSSEVDLIIRAENEGEAGYLADSELGSIESQSDFRIVNIEQITEEEYKELKIVESNSSDSTAPEKIMNFWTSEFGGRNPTSVEKFEFYRKMREQKFDAGLIMDTLREKICPDWDNK
jgi:hypothetical protein